MRCFRNLALAENNLVRSDGKSTTFDQTIPKGHPGPNYYSNLSSFKKGPLLLIGDQSGYLNVCDMNGLVI